MIAKGSQQGYGRKKIALRIRLDGNLDRLGCSSWAGGGCCHQYSYY
jgi:hypothetical protein